MNSPISWRYLFGRWCAYITVGGKRHFLARYGELDEKAAVAAEARAIALGFAVEESRE